MRKGKFLGLACLLLISIFTLCACSGGPGGIGGQGGNNEGNGPSTQANVVPGFASHTLSYNEGNNQVYVNTVKNSEKSILTKQFYSENTNKDVRLEEVYKNIYQAVALKVSIASSEKQAEFELGFTNDFYYFKNYQDLDNTDAYVFDIKDKGYMAFVNPDKCFMNYSRQYDIKGRMFEEFGNAIFAISKAEYAFGDTYKYNCDEFGRYPWNYEIKTWPHQILVEARMQDKGGEDRYERYMITHLNDDSCYGIQSSYPLNQNDILNRCPDEETGGYGDGEYIFEPNEYISVGKYYAHRPATQSPCAVDTCNHSYSPWFDYNVDVEQHQNQNIVKYRYCPLCGQMEFRYKSNSEFNQFPHFEYFYELGYFPSTIMWNNNAFQYDLSINGQTSKIIRRGNIIELYSGSKKLVIFGYKDNSIIYEEDLNTHKSRFFDLNDESIYDKYLNAFGHISEFVLSNDYLNRISATFDKDNTGLIKENEMSVTNTYFDQDNKNAFVKDVFGVKIAEDSLTLALNRDHLDKVNNNVINNENYSLKISCYSNDNRYESLVGPYKGFDDCNEITFDHPLIPITDPRYSKDYFGNIKVFDYGDSFKLDYIPQIIDRENGNDIGDKIKQSNGSIKYDLTSNHLLDSNYTVKVTNYEDGSETMIKSQGNSANITVDGKDVFVYDLDLGYNETDGNRFFISIASENNGEWIETERILTSSGTGLNDVLQCQMPLYAIIDNFQNTQLSFTENDPMHSNIKTIGMDTILLLHKEADGTYKFMAHYVTLLADIETNTYTIEVSIMDKDHSRLVLIKEYEISDIGSTMTNVPRTIKKTNSAPVKKLLTPFKYGYNMGCEVIDLPFEKYPGKIAYIIENKELNLEKRLEFVLDITDYNDPNNKLMERRWAGDTENGLCTIYEYTFKNFYEGSSYGISLFKWYVEK